MIFLIKNRLKLNIGLIGATHGETRKIMLEGPSGILNLAHEEQLNYRYYTAQGKIIFENGCKIFLFSSEKYEALRGFEFDCIWADEFAKFYKPEETLQQMIFCCRSVKPQFILTTTPRPLKVLQELIKRKGVKLVRGSSYENKKNLASSYLKLIQQFENTPLGQQEIHGMILDDSGDSPWSGTKILYYVPKEENLIYRTLAVDPSVANGNETGIILAAYDKSMEKIIILEDFSLSDQVSNWVPYLCELIPRENIHYLAIETNQGGDLLQYTLNHYVPYRISINKFFARENKQTRAMSIAYLYRQGFILHEKKLPLLEEQMLFFQGSLDRVDALVWAVESILKTLREKGKKPDCKFWLID